MTDSKSSFRILELSKYIVVDILGSPQPDELPRFEETTSRLVEKKQPLVINGSRAENLDAAVIAAFTRTARRFHLHDLKLAWTGFNDRELQKLKEAGVEGKSDVRLSEALEWFFFDRGSGLNSATFIKAFVDSTIRTMKVQAATECQRQSVYLAKDDPNQLEGELSSIINVLGDEICYLVILSFPESTFLKIMSRMLDEEFTEINDEIRDGASELANIIFGQAKVILNKTNAKITPQIPTLISGSRFPGQENISEITKVTTDLELGRNITVPFSSDIGAFYVRVWFTEDFVSHLKN